MGTQAAESFPGYAGKLLFVWLDSGRFADISLSPELMRKTIGGVGLGAELLWEYARPGTTWDDPGNPVFLLSGPLAATRVSGAGTFCAVTIGAMTGYATSTQANGMFGAFLRTCGYDGIAIFGQAPEWTYLAVSPTGVELRPADQLLGLDTWETESAVSAELGKGPVSVYAIGPAGERRVRFAVLAGDKGHVAAHNGVGAVLGSKRLKAVAAVRGKFEVPIARPRELNETARLMFADARAAGDGLKEKWGTAGAIETLYKSGMFPIRNLTTSLWPHVQGVTGQTMRTRHAHKLKACWGCTMHCRYLEVKEGPYAGYKGEEPEYEAVAATTSLIDNPELGASVVLTNMADRLGMNVNELGWLLGWVMEGNERGWLTPEMMDGRPLHFGDAEGAMEWVRRIANRQGFGDLLAEGVVRAGRALGGEAELAAVGTVKGATPRGHDHRARWDELLDTCLSNTGTIEVQGGYVQPEQLGIPPVKNRFDPLEVARVNALVNGRRIFEDSVGICRFTTENIRMLADCVNHVTGFDLSIAEIMTAGKRAVNRLRAFNLRHGLDPETERPTPRYGSQPVDGPAAGFHFALHFPAMRAAYWKEMGWDERDGRPLPETLRSFGLEDAIAVLWERS